MNGNCKIIEDSFNRVLGHNGFQEVFQFKELDIEDKLQRANIENIRLNNGTLTPNEVRATYGEDPLEGGDTVINNTNPMAGLALSQKPTSENSKYLKALEHVGLIKKM